MVAGGSCAVALTHARLAFVGGSGSLGTLGDVPLEFVGEIAGARAMAEASDIEGGSAASRHVVSLMVALMWLRRLQRSDESAAMSKDEAALPS